MKRIKILLMTILCSIPFHAYSQQSSYVADEDVSSIFYSGGYGALFGGAMGVATLPFMNGSPMQNLRIVAGGASIGFMLGSAYGFYALANANKNSYFNYNINEDEDAGTYYSMPPTYPTQGKVLKKKDQNVALIKAKTPSVGALFMGDGKNIDMAFPYFWIQDRQISFLLADITF